MKGFLRIGDTTFELNDSALYSKALFYLDDEDIDHYIMAINALFKLGLYGDEEVYPEKTAIIIGNEANGITNEAAKEANRLIKIPMEGKVESLNAGVAAAILMYEVYRQKRNR